MVIELSFTRVSQMSQNATRVRADGPDAYSQGFFTCTETG